MGSGALPANVPNPAAFASALASGTTAEAALARSATAAQTMAGMRAQAALPDTPVRQVAAGFAAGDLGSLHGIAGNATGEAALAAAMSRGGNLADALAVAARAMASRQDQENRGTVQMSERDARSAAMARGVTPDGGDGAAQRQQQLQSAAVRANPDATALAEGLVPAGDADPSVTGRLLRRVSDPAALLRQLGGWAAAVQQQYRAARATPGNAKASMTERLAQGRATPDDIAEIIRQARTGTPAGLARWLSSPAASAAEIPQADHRPDSGVQESGVQESGVAESGMQESGVAANQ
jgi:hypothetical protein